MATLLQAVGTSLIVAGSLGAEATLRQRDTVLSLLGRFVIGAGLVVASWWLGRM